MSDAAQVEQWALVSMQVVNWGGFNGHKTLRFAPPGEATVISGRTGSGKSTLMDANTVLMHSNRRFNRASNDAVGSGRTLLSYMRGHIDKTATRRLMLRGEDKPTWSALAQTWRSSSGIYFSTFAAFYVRANDTKPVRRFGHFPGEFNLQNFEKYIGGEYATSPLRPQTIRADHPEIVFVPSYEALRQWLFDQIGISETGGRLTNILYRIQTSGPIGSVHQLFETLVLDKPDALIDLLNRSRDQWTETQNTYREVSDREAKAALLEPLPETWSKYQENQSSGAFFDSLEFGDQPANTPFWLWIRTRQFDLLDAQEQDLTAKWHARQGTARDAERAHEEARRQWETASRAFFDAGGEALQKASDDARSAKLRLEAVREDRQALSADLTGIVRVPTTQQTLDEQRLASSAFVGSYSQESESAKAALAEAAGRRYAAEQDIGRIRKDRTYYQGRTDAISPRLSEIREWYARESGIAVGDLRFVGELIDMDPDWESWRTAAELALGGFAGVLLIPSAQARRFREAVNALPTDTRISSLTVPDDVQLPADVGTDRLAGRFILREHRYSAWLSRSLAERFDHLCVESARELNDLPRGSRGVTIHGQVRDGTRGAHGGQNARNRPRIGFSSAAVVATLDEQLNAAIALANSLNGEQAAAQAAVDKLESARRAHQVFLRAAEAWHRYDEQAVEREIGTIEARAEALRADNHIARLEGERDRLEAIERDRQKAANRAADEVQALDTQRRATMQRKDDAYEHLRRMEGTGVAEPDLARLDAVVLEFPGIDELVVESFNPREVSKLVESLKWARGMATRDVRLYRERLVTMFDKYINRWPTVGLDTEPDVYYDQFSEIREHNSLLGLPEAKEKFATNVMRFTAMAASSVKDSYDDARREIADRLNRINELLSEQEFGGRAGHHLSITTARHQMPEETADFLAALAGLGAYTTKGIGYEEMVERYERFEAFMDLVATDADVERLFDVRKHVYLHALEARPESDDPITHDTFGEKSGGEYQELCAFVLAAAVRYQVGSQGEPVPRFAPVFLDEGLIKADPEVTRRAVNVWRDLGFQPIIAVPLDKHESVMVASSFAWTVSKDDNGLSRLDLAQKKASA